MPNDQNHQQKRDFLRVTGVILTSVGGIFALIGFSSFFGAFGGGGFPRYFWCAFVGLPLLGFGVNMLKGGFMGEIARYQSDEVAPVAKDTINYVAKEARPGIEAIASAVRNSSPNSVEDRLLHLDSLRAKSLITESEYQSQRKRILEEI